MRKVESVCKAAWVCPETSHVAVVVIGNKVNIQLNKITFIIDTNKYETF